VIDTLDLYPQSVLDLYPQSVWRPAACV